MAVSGCAEPADVGRGHRGQQYVQQTSAAVSQYANPFEAVAAGYVAASPDRLPGRVLRQPADRGGERGRPADARPAARRRADLRGDAVGPARCSRRRSTSCRRPRRRCRCPTARSCSGTGARRSAARARRGGGDAARHHGVPAVRRRARCVQPTPYMSMVWQVPVAGGPLAIQPPDIQIVEAAIMAGRTGRRGAVGIRPKG